MVASPRPEILVVYPRDCKDTLRAVAGRVELIEINNTFYRPPVGR